jgi:hypothetical protein
MPSASTPVRFVVYQTVGPLKGRALSIDWELEDWLLEAGEATERKASAGSSLTAIETLIREFWVFDVQTRNGGISQYFCNYPSRWEKLKAASSLSSVPALDAIVTAVDRVIGSSSEPYSAALAASPDLEQHYEKHQLEVRRELRRLAREATGDRLS